MFSLGGSEILIIAVAVLLLFGPDKIPQMARTVGRFMREFNKYKDIMESTVRAEIYKEDWAKDAGKPDAKSAGERISQAAGAVQDLVAAQRAEDAAPAAEDAATTPEHAAALATDEDEEDEE